MAALPFKVKAIFDYASQHEDDLSFSNGQIITVTDEEDDDWYYGEFAGANGETKQGLFPRNFVERFEPTTPPRPSRPARPKQEPDVVQEPGDNERPSEEIETESAPQEHEQPTVHVTNVEEHVQPSAEDSAEHSGRAETAETTVAASAQPVKSPEAPQTLPSQPSMSTAPVQASRAPQQPPTKGPPPAVATKPSSSAFRDRIAAFNKPAAPPVPSIKPGQSSGSSFVKKPFVPPPPSRDAYVRPPPEVPQAKIYKTQDDDSHGIPAKEDIRSYVPPSESGDAEDQPKPTSLKERIALLQKQQLEQAARHAEAAQKKEKPKKPPKKKSEYPPESIEAGEHASLDRTTSGASVPEVEHHVSTAPNQPRHRSKSKERTSFTSPAPAPQEFLSDPNDADQSAGGDTEDGEMLAGNKITPRIPVPGQAPPARQPTLPLKESEEEEQLETSEDPRRAETRNESDEEGNEDEDEDEEEDIDPEVKRRMEIRDRMAKMSGGMGMAGMFGAPGGLPSMGAKKPKTSSGTSKKQSVEGEAATSTSPPSQAVPVMALPGMSMPGITRVRTPELMDNPMEPAMAPESRQQRSATEASQDLQQQQDEITEKQLKEKLRSPPPSSIDRTIPAVPPTPSGPPPLPTAREPPPPPPSTRPSQAPPAIPARPADTGSESDDELSATPQETATIETSDGMSPTGRRVPPVPPVTTGPMSQQPRSPTSATSVSTTSASTTKSPTSPQNPASFEKRSSRAPPPIPGPAAPTISPPPQNRAPPPPPPPTRESDDHPAPAPSLPPELQQEESEEVTEYEGDYDTDIAAGETHKDALRADDHSSSADDTLTGDEASYHHSGLPSLGPPLPPPSAPSSGAPRGAPPPPPSQPPKPSRQSSEAPRMPPPPPNQPPLPRRQSSDVPRAAPPPPPVPAQTRPIEEDEYDPYNYNAPPGVPPKHAPPRDPMVTPKAERSQSDLYKTSAPDPEPVQMEAAEPAYASPNPAAQAPLQTPRPRQSLDVPHASASRRSIDASRSSMEQGFIAEDLDVGRNTQWWVQRKMPPPVLHDRNDVVYEIEESTAISSSGEELVMRHVYALFLDYSQTVLTARFSPRDLSRADFNQRHQPPPTPLRQDQLENAHNRFGIKIADVAKAKVNSIVGNGTPVALVTEMFNVVPDALPPIGTRAYGALIYTNLANASVQQYDEIRSGDIVTFRNAKLEGHQGKLKQKYKVDVGKPDHVAIVEEWDGTRRKIKAWEQGRESRKVKLENFRLGDLRSGEVKVWRVVSREWVGWGRKS